MKTDTPTPETDQALLMSECSWNCTHSFCQPDGTELATGNDGIVVLAEFARKLERQRDALLSALENLERRATFGNVYDLSEALQAITAVKGDQG